MDYSNYFANLIVSDRYLVTGQVPSPLSTWSRHVKPLGGKILLGKSFQTQDANVFAAARQSLANELEKIHWDGEATVEIREPLVAVTRGGLAGAGSWSHLFGNAANTGVVSETRVKSGLHVLWYGDPGPGDMVNRHEGAVGPLSTHGRLFVQGENDIQAYDAYNGLFLWKQQNPGATRTGVFQNNNPSNMAASEERLFHFIKDECFELDAANGNLVRVHRLPKPYDDGTYEWGYLAVHENTLLGAATIRKELEEKHGVAAK